MKTTLKLILALAVLTTLVGCSSSRESRRHGHPMNVRHVNAPERHHTLPPQDMPQP